MYLGNVLGTFLGKGSVRNSSAKSEKERICSNWRRPFRGMWIYSEYCVAHGQSTLELVLLKGAVAHGENAPGADLLIPACLRRDSMLEQGKSTRRKEWQ